MNKRDVLNIIVKSAQDYHKNLEGNNILFIAGSTNYPVIYEVAFMKRNFLHLTGVDIANLKIESSTSFYNRCLSGRININDFTIAPINHTDEKLRVLPELMNIHKTAKKMGDYNGVPTYLYTDELAGNVVACLGFTNTGKFNIPSVALEIDKDKMGKIPYRISVILRKPISQENYTELCYAAKGVDLRKIAFPEEWAEKIDIGEFY